MGIGELGTGEELISQVTTAVEQLRGLPARLFRLTGGELETLVSLMDGVAAAAAGVRFAVTAEAVARGEVAESQAGAQAASTRRRDRRDVNTRSDTSHVPAERLPQSSAGTAGSMSAVVTLALSVGFVVLGFLLAASVIWDASQPMGRHRVGAPENTITDPAPRPERPHQSSARRGLESRG
jgi:hypothetical protein